jgi:hypothetical protein
MAEVAAPRALLAAILRFIAELRPLPPPGTSLSGPVVMRISDNHGSGAT